jgi:hypothetical protein
MLHPGPPLQVRFDSKALMRRYEPGPHQIVLFQQQNERKVVK